jgi:hypothetical protein
MTLRVLPGGEVDDGLERLSHAELVAKLRRAIPAYEGLKRDLQLAEEGMRELRARNAGLKGRITKLMREDPQAETIESLLAYWRNRCRGPQSNVDISVDGKRGEVVRKTLKRLVDADPDPLLASPDKEQRAQALQNATDRACERIRSAIDGCALFPFEGAYGRRYPEQVPGSRRKDDLILILRDGPKMEQFEALRDDDEKRRAYAWDLKRRIDTQRNFRAVLQSLDPEYGEVLARAIRWVQSQ